MVNIGDKAPDFTAKDQDGNEITLSSFKGKKIALYFYPKDNTPGCNKEACSFRDHHKALLDKGIVVLGVSADDSASHKKFVTKFSLPFSLVADTEKEIITSYDVYKEKNMYGKKYLGIVRTTFLIDESFNIVHIFKKVKTEVHAEEVLEKFAELG